MTHEGDEAVLNTVPFKEISIVYVSRFLYDHLRIQFTVILQRKVKVVNQTLKWNNKSETQFCFHYL